MKQVRNTGRRRAASAAIVLLIICTFLVIPAAAASFVPAGGTVFRGEQGLNIAAGQGVGTDMILGYWASGTNPYADPPSATVPVTNWNSFFVDPSMQVGTWYNNTGTGPKQSVFQVTDPHLSISVYDMNNVDRTDGSVVRVEGFAGSHLKFRILSNLDVVAFQRGFMNPANLTIRVGTPDGNVFQALMNATGVLTQLTPGDPIDPTRNQTAIRHNPWWITQVAGQNLDVWDVSKPHYPLGTYTFWATCNINSMNDNYGDVGKTRSQTRTIQIIDEDTILTANTNTVVRGNNFALTITGRPNSNYVLWVKGSAAETNISVPRIRAGQQGVYQWPNAVALAYNWRVTAPTNVGGDIPAFPLVLEHDGTYTATYTAPYANVTLNDAGKRTVAFSTNQSTRDKTWIFRVERINSAIDEDFDEVIVRVGDPLPDPTTHITLSPGWNFISTPKRLTDGNNTAAIFADVDTAGRSLFLYNAASGAWETMTAASPVLPLDAIWIYANETSHIPLDFDSGAAQVPPSKQLHEGWNAIGFSSTEPATARDTLIDVDPAWTRVLGWNTSTQSYNLAIIRGGTGAYSDTREMLPMQGYWISMTGPGVLYALS